MTKTEKLAHKHATACASAYVLKFKRPVAAHAAEGVYVNAYVQYLRNQVGA